MTATSHSGPESTVGAPPKPFSLASDQYSRSGNPVVSARLLLIFVLLITALAYLGTLRYDFVYDDTGQIVYNPLVQSWHYAPRYLVEHMWSNQINVPPNYYRPLFLLWCLMNYTLFGLHPAGWHATTVLMHLLATGLVFRLARRIGLDAFAAAIAAAIFGLHPAHVESVAWISGVTDPLMAVFFLAGLLAYFRSRVGAGKQRVAWLALALVAYMLAMMSKETGIVLVLVTFSSDLIFPDPICNNLPPARRIRSAIVGAIPFAAVAAAYLALRFHALSAIGHPIVNLPLRAFPLTWPSLLWFYVRKTVWPVHLSPFYGTPYVTRFDVHLFVLPLCGLIAISALFYAWYRCLSNQELEAGPAYVLPHRSEKRIAAFALVWIIAPLLPVLDIASLEPHEIAHDRYLYLPLIGIAFLVALAIRRLPALAGELFGQPLPQTAVTLVLLALLAAGAINQASFWASDLLLFYRATSVAPASIGAANNLANALLERNYYDEGIQIHQRLIRSDPTYWLSYYNLGNAYYKLGRYAEAEQVMVRAAQLNNINPRMFLYLAVIQMKTGHLKDAELNARQAVRMWPHGTGAHFILGEALEQEGDFTAAAQEFQSELDLNPGQGEARARLAEAQQHLVH